MIYKLTFLLLFVSLHCFAQDYTISVLPTSLNYSFKYQKTQLYVLSQHAEIEKKIKDKYSIALGLYYDRDKEKAALGSLKSARQAFLPSIRYYLNQQKNNSGFYLRSGLMFGIGNYQQNGRYASLDGSIIKIISNETGLSLDFVTGYKFVLPKERFSLDFGLDLPFRIYNKENINTYYANGNKTKEKVYHHQNGDYNLSLDLRIGYRFGFKK